jgi:hypothetical protein
MLATAVTIVHERAAAQQQAHGLRAEAALEATHWVLDGGTYSTASQTRWGSTLRLGLRASVGSRVSALLALTYAAEGSFEPGVAGGAVELAVRFARIGEARRRFNGFVTAGIGLLHFDADRQERQLDACYASLDCRFEGVGFRSGWRPMLAGGIGIDIPVSSTLELVPQAQVARPLGSSPAGPENNSAVLRVGMGVAWR